MPVSVIQSIILKKGYGVEVLADQYCVSVAFLRKVIREKRLKATRLGRRVIILAEDWENFLKDSNKN